MWNVARWKDRNTVECFVCAKICHFEIFLSLCYVCMWRGCILEVGEVLLGYFNLLECFWMMLVDVESFQSFVSF